MPELLNLRGMIDALSNSNIDDDTLWQQLRAGDRMALGSLAKRWYRPLLHYGTKLTGNRALIEDSIQDLFLALWEKHLTLAAVGSIRAYLFVSLRNNLLRVTKQNSTYVDLTDADFPDDGLTNPEYLCMQSEETESVQHRLHQSLKRLPKRQRESIYLRYYENLSYDEIAVVMGLNRQVVANYLQHALHNLRHHWPDLTYALLLVDFLL